jgi:hypothetical protein
MSQASAIFEFILRCQMVTPWIPVFLYASSLYDQKGREHVRALGSSLELQRWSEAISTAARSLTEVPLDVVAVTVKNPAPELCGLMVSSTHSPGSPVLTMQRVAGSQRA